MPSTSPSRKVLAERICTLTILLSVLLTSTRLTGQVVGQQVAKQSPWGTKFWLYTPPGYVASTPAPLLMYLHGGGSIGDDLTLLTNPTLVAKGPPSIIANGGWPSSRPLIVVSPQLKRDLSVPNYNDQEWDMDSVNEVLEYVKTLLNVNVNKVYLTGMSLGGAACWSFAQAYPSKIAALVPMSGKTDLTQACTIKDLGIWAFHGGNDNFVDLDHTVNMVTAVSACNGAFKPKLNIWNARQHEGWNETWNLTNGYPIYDWMLKFTKGDNSNISPYSNAGPDLKLLQRSEPYHLYGEYFDWDGSISSVNWVQVSGTSLTLANTTSQILEIANAPVGTYGFELRVIDNNGVQSADAVTLQIVAAPGANEPVITDLIMLDGATDQNIVSLTEGAVINKTLLETNQFNLRALGNSKTGSIVISVNSDQNARTNNGTSALIRGQASALEWVIENGDYVITATPYTGSQGSGTRGIARSMKISVIGDFVPLTKYYAAPTKDITKTANWWSKPDYTGAHPNFLANYINLILPNSSTDLTGALTISGINSVLTVTENCTLNINSSFNGKVNIESNGVVNVNVSTSVAFGKKIDPNSQVNFNQNATQIPSANYGNIRLSGNGSTKTLATDSISVVGSMVIDAGVSLNGAVNNSSVISLSGNLTIEETGIFNPATNFRLFLNNQTTQQLILRCSKASFYGIEATNGNNIQLVNPVAANTTTLELGSSSGGGLTLNDGSKLILGKHNLSIIGKGTINTLDQSGELSTKKSSNININSSSISNSFMYLTALNDSLNTLNVNLSGGTSLNIMKKIYVVDSLKMSNGTLNSNASVVLVSSPSKTARIGRNEGTGYINGKVEYQRYLEKERLYKYITFPVSGLSVSDIQSAIPVTGTFTGASTGPGLSTNPSMYLYNDPNWVAYPVVSNLDTLEVGRGYSVFIRNNVTESKLQLLGSPRQGDFTFNLTSDPNVNIQTDGWNLIGNPYLSSIKWRTNLWSSNDVNENIAIRDNTTGQFLYYNASSGEGNLPEGIIPAGQAFWVQTGLDPSLTVHEIAKTSLGSGILFRTESDTHPFKTLGVEMIHKGLSDKAFITLNPTSVNEFDKLKDAVKQKNDYFNLSSLSTDNIALAINNISVADCEHTIPLKLEASEQGEYRFEFSGSLFNDTSQSAELFDSYRDSLVSIKENGRYEFTISNDSLSSKANRFIIRMNTDMVKPMLRLENNVLYSSVSENIQWLLNGNIIEGATNATYKPKKSGEYQVVATGSCSKASDPLSYLITGKEVEIDANDVMLFPNPAEKFIRVKTDLTVSNHVTYEIYDLLGQKIRTGSISPEEIKHGFDIYLNEGIKPGMHILKLSSTRFDAKYRFTVK